MEIDGRETKETDKNKLCHAHDCENLWVLPAHSLKSIRKTGGEQIKCAQPYTLCAHLLVVPSNFLSLPSIQFF